MRVRRKHQPVADSYVPDSITAKRAIDALTDVVWVAVPLESRTPAKRMQIELAAQAAVHEIESQLRSSLRKHPAYPRPKATPGVPW